MKKNKFVLIFWILFMGFLNLNFENTQNITCSQKLANIKAFAIANAEIPKETLDCWEEVNEDGNGPLTHKTYCGDCKAILGRTFLYKSTCTP
jgi:hypothetical protein